MMHWRANRLLASLPDDTLPHRVALEVEVHAASCARCRRKLEELKLAEQLMHAMPTALLPREWDPNSYRRLSSLARWSQEPGSPEPGRWRAPALSLVSAFAILVIAIMVGRYSPIEQSAEGPFTIAMTQPDFATGTAYWK
jgi:anti-sigma factor RsiW